ncbi:polysaccharide deacetylase family protein [Larkinella terrae]|uniref:Polysaccharide deacetylase family protein n=1 Tax=Larkinella terrae TaxID=2025311 RepID=A0A7K0EI82_9BACT|nr:polysaccharide deacetylase family protein [Larkinella terrae]MRS61178.1 polysaccharide deacetylase family protein [Larkinella terrae]
MLIVWLRILCWCIVPEIDNCVKDALPPIGVARKIKNHQKYIPDGKTRVRGAIIRGDTTIRKLAIVFTGDEYADGGEVIRETLAKNRVPASFFLTGRFYRNPAFQALIRNLKKDGHYLGAHSNEHLLYCDWSKRDSLLVDHNRFRTDLDQNYAEMRHYGISKKDARFFLPPYEWYNDTIADWTRKAGLQLISYSPGTLSHADYTTPDLKNYRSSPVILKSIYDYEQQRPAGLSGFVLLLHIGTHPDRTDKLYAHLDELLKYLRQKSYRLVRVSELF